MPGLVYHFILALVLAAGSLALMQAYRNTIGYATTLDDIQTGVTNYAGKNCAGLSPTGITGNGLRSGGHLARTFNDQGSRFGFPLNDHPLLTMQVENNPAYQVYLNAQVNNRAGPGNARTYLPPLDHTLYRAANPGHQLLAYNQTPPNCHPAGSAPAAPDWTALCTAITHNPGNPVTC